MNIEESGDRTCGSCHMHHQIGYYLTFPYLGISATYHQNRMPKLKLHSDPKFHLKQPHARHNAETRGFEVG